MRYRLRTLLIVMLLSGPLSAWGWKEWQRYSKVVGPLQARQSELRRAKALNNGSRQTKAGLRHAELRVQRDQQAARQSSVFYRLVSVVAP
jgi:hypothetical protein